MKALIFRARGEFARFRCAYTTTSALTYSLMHPIAIKGLIGAIMGIDYKDLYEYTKDMKIGIEVLNPVRKDMQSFNLIAQIKNNGSHNFQTRVEFLRNVDYRIFIIDDLDKLEDIKKTLISREYVFTPYLGASEHIAKLTYEDLADTKELTGNNIMADSVFPAENLVMNSNDIQLFLDRIPVKNAATREYIEYKKVAFSSGNKLETNSKDIKDVGGYNVYFF